MRKPGKKPAANTEYQLRIRRDRGMRGVEWGPRACPCAAWGNAFKSNLGTRAHFCPTAPPRDRHEAPTPHPASPCPYESLRTFLVEFKDFCPAAPLRDRHEAPTPHPASPCPYGRTRPCLTQSSPSAHPHSTNYSSSTDPHTASHWSSPVFSPSHLTPARANLLYWQSLPGLFGYRERSRF